MIRAILGSAVGGVIAGAIALVASAQGASAPETTWPAAPPTPYGMTVAADSSSAATASINWPLFMVCSRSL